MIHVVKRDMLRESSDNSTNVMRLTRLHNKGIHLPIKGPHCCQIFSLHCLGLLRERVLKIRK